MSTARSTRVPGAIGLTSIRSRNDTWHWLQHSLVGGIIQVSVSLRPKLLWECIPLLSGELRAGQQMMVHEDPRLRGRKWVQVLRKALRWAILGPESSGG